MILYSQIDLLFQNAPSATFLEVTREPDENGQQLQALRGKGRGKTTQRNK